MRGIPIPLPAQMLHVTSRDVPAMSIRQGCPLHGQSNKPMCMVAPPHKTVMLSAPHVMPVAHHSGLRFSICRQQQIDDKLAYGCEHRMLDTRGHVVFRNDARTTMHKTYCGSTFIGVVRGTWELVECTHPSKGDGKQGLYVRKRIWERYSSVTGSTRVDEGDVLPMHLPDGYSWVVSWTVAHEWTEREDMDPDDLPPPCSMGCTSDEPCSDEDARAWGQYTPLPLVTPGREQFVCD